MKSSTPQGAALVLVLCGSLLAITGSLTTLVTGDRPFMAVAAVGFAMQFAGWRLHGRRNRGAR